MALVSADIGTTVGAWLRSASHRVCVTGDRVGKCARSAACECDGVQADRDGASRIVGL
jgi:hypothetical protein